MPRFTPFGTNIAEGIQKAREIPFKNFTEGIQRALKVNKTFATKDKEGIARDQDGNTTIPVVKAYSSL